MCIVFVSLKIETVDQNSTEIFFFGTIFRLTNTGNTFTYLCYYISGGCTHENY